MCSLGFIGGRRVVVMQGGILVIEGESRGRNKWEEWKGVIVS